MANTERGIEAYVRENEGARQQTALKELTIRTGSSERTIRTHFKRLDGRTIKVVKEGRENRLYSIEHWRRTERQTFDIRVPHTEKLKQVLEIFHSQLPLLDEFGASETGGHPAPFVHGARISYAPDRQLEFERHPLFEDLLDHLAQLSLPTKIAEAWAVFKEGTARLASASRGLWDACTMGVEHAFRLTVGSDWRGDRASENCVALLYEFAVAAAAGDGHRSQALRGRKGEPRQVEEWLEYWQGGTGLVRRRAKARDTPDAFGRDVGRRLQRLFDAGLEGPIRDSAKEVVAALAPLQKNREALLRALEEATYYEVFPGACKFTRP